jgi:hypothetical protein
MFVTNLQHFLDDNGSIPQDIPKEAKEFAYFLALLVDYATSGNDDSPLQIRCNKMKCHGFVIPIITEESEEIYWKCSECRNEGVISNWRGIKWDNMNHKI